MNLNLKGKKALVTGASSGLGAAAAKMLAQEGANVIICSRNIDKLKATATLIKESTNSDIKIIKADVSLDSDIKSLAEKTDQVDILVSNAGGPPPGQLTEHDNSKWTEASKLVLFSAINLTNVFIDNMIKQKWGRLIYITSIGVMQPVDDLILSNTFRAGVTGFCKTVSNNYAQYGITANCVCPGFTDTERLNKLLENRAEQAGTTIEEVVKNISGSIPVNRLGHPDELASLITFLASDKASYITGSSIAVDGGFNRALI
ncbi:MAG: SDR family oxidoreductase [candidate division Zixibacteria bacterium]|nr:SDR family oxidoreductase [candidate division Zixibacteria bacterium]